MALTPLALVRNGPVRITTPDKLTLDTAGPWLATNVPDTFTAPVELLATPATPEVPDAPVTVPITFTVPVE